MKQTGSRVNVYIPDSLHAAGKRLAASRGMSFSGLITSLIASNVDKMDLDTLQARKQELEAEMGPLQVQIDLHMKRVDLDAHVRAHWKERQERLYRIEGHKVHTAHSHVRNWISGFVKEHPEFKRMHRAEQATFIDVLATKLYNEQNIQG